MTKVEADKEINRLVKLAENSVREAEVIADEYGLSFGLDIAYGMGGHYYGKGKPAYMTRQQAIEKLSDSTNLSDDEIKSLREVLQATTFDDESVEYSWKSSTDSCYEMDEFGWQPSSQSC